MSRNLWINKCPTRTRRTPRVLVLSHDQAYAHAHLTGVVNRTDRFLLLESPNKLQVIRKYRAYVKIKRISVRLFRKNLTLGVEGNPLIESFGVGLCLFLCFRLLLCMRSIRRSIWGPHTHNTSLSLTLKLLKSSFKAFLQTQCLNTLNISLC